MKFKPSLNPKPNQSFQHLVSWQVLFHGFFLVGIFVSLFSLLVFFWTLQELGGFSASDLFFCFTNWQDGYKGYTGDQLNQFLIQAQSSCFVSIILMQIRKTLTTVSHSHRFQVLTFFSDTKSETCFQCGQGTNHCTRLFRPGRNTVTCTCSSLHLSQFSS